MNTPPIILLRKTEVLNRTGLCKSTIYNKISKGTFPPPISISRRSVAWPEYEIDAVIRAFISGKSEDEVKHLVHEMVEAREHITTSWHSL